MEVVSSFPSSKTVLAISRSFAEKKDEALESVILIRSARCTCKRLTASIQNLNTMGMVNIVKLFPSFYCSLAWSNT